MATYGQRKDTQSQVDEQITDAAGVSAKKVLLVGRDSADAFQDIGVDANGQVSVKQSTDSIASGSASLTPKFAKIDAATSGDNTIVAAVATKKIRVVSLCLVADGVVTTRFESDTSGTALTGQISLVDNTGFVLPYNPVGWFETVAGELLNLELSGAVSVDGCLTYIEV